ncbi:DNA polymerase III subunit beta [Candidatus Profftia sp. (ex Adelges kitamiensis)]|uniref:DNA polymerase III subunit beta n=1 Tax=Candidatus Profftia sp. (ex Adelges kitamiensis) TaxID=2864218 RepID=UPI001CE26E0F|nr:DNA polymerase III subunit beta [Candidatus Profftia sp. (ex Adelges kitamiensis)]
MKFIVKRDHLLKPLQQVSSLKGIRSTLPILNNLLLRVKENYLFLIGSDLEIEIIARIPILQDYVMGAITVSTRKFVDICRGLPEGAEITVVLEGNRMLVYSERSKFYLATLPASHFPNVDDWQSEVELSLPQVTLRKLIESTQFSMANQDVRYYLNGMLFETKNKYLRTVATDGHRLAVCSMSIGKKVLPYYSAIVPRKGVIDLYRLLDNSETLLFLEIGSSNIRAHIGDFTFTSKLICGLFPDYRLVLPKNPNKMLKASCDKLKQAFSRVAILSNEKFRGVRFCLSNKQLRITANNPEQEEAEEIMDVNYEGHALELGFNVSYVLDILSVLKCKYVHIFFTDESSSVQIEDAETTSTTYIVMPMRI